MNNLRTLLLVLLFNYLNAATLYVNTTSERTGAGTREDPFGSLDLSFGSLSVGGTNEIIFLSAKNSDSWTKDISFTTSLKIQCSDTSPIVIEYYGKGISVDSAVDFTLINVQILFRKPQSPPPISYFIQLNNMNANLLIERSIFTASDNYIDISSALIYINNAKKAVLNDTTISYLKNSFSSFAIINTKICPELQLLSFKIFNTVLNGGSLLANAELNSLILLILNSNFKNNIINSNSTVNNGGQRQLNNFIETIGTLNITNLSLENNTFELSLIKFTYSSGDFALERLNLRNNIHMGDRPFAQLLNLVELNSINTNKNYLINSISSDNNVFSNSFLQIEGFNNSKFTLNNTNFTQNLAMVLISTNATKSIEFENLNCVRTNLMDQLFQRIYPNYSEAISLIQQGPCLSIQNHAELSIKATNLLQNKAVDSVSGISIERNEFFKNIYLQSITKSTKMEKVNCSDNILFSNGQEEPISHHGVCLSILEVNDSITLTNSRFLNNSIDVNLNKFVSSNEKALFFHHSPCLFLRGSLTDLSITLTTFSSNKGYSDSTCGTFYGKSVTIISSDFFLNQADTNSESLSMLRSSGALVMATVNSKLTSVRFQMNSAHRCAAICVQNNLNLELQTHAWDSTSFSSNKAGTAVIEISQDIKKGSLLVRTSLFEANIVSREGIVLTLHKSQFSIGVSGTEFKHNIGKGRSVLFSIKHSIGSMSLSTCIFTNNSLILEKEQPNSGLFVIHSNSESVKIDFSLCSFIENTFNNKTIEGGIFVLNSGTLTDDRSTYKNNFYLGTGSFVVILFQARAELRTLTYISQKDVLVSSCFVLRNQGILILDSALIQNLYLQQSIFYLETEGARLDVTNTKIDGFSAIKNVEGSLLNAAGSQEFNTRINFIKCNIVNGDSFGISMISLLEFAASFESCNFEGLSSNSLLAKLSERSSLYITSSTMKNLSLGSLASPVCFFRVLRESYLSIKATSIDESNTCKSSIGTYVEQSEVYIDSENIFNYRFDSWEQAIYTQLENSIGTINRVSISSMPAAVFLVARGLNSSVSLSEVKLLNYKTIFPEKNSYSLLLLCDSCSKFLFTNGLISNLSFDARPANMKDYSAILLINVKQGAILESNFEFIRGSLKGSVLCSINHTSLRVEKNVFRENKAISMGGAIFMDCKSNQDCGVSLKDNQFTNNTAGFAGGAIFTSSLSVIDTINSNDYALNSAENGKNYAGSGLKLKLANTASMQNNIIYSSCNLDDYVCELKNILPGNQLPSLYFTVHDIYDQQFTSKNSSQAQLIKINAGILNTSDPVKNNTLKGRANYLYKPDIQNLTFIGGQISSALDNEYVVFNGTELRSNSSFTYMSFSSSFFSNKEYLYPIKISFDNCGRGEFFNSAENTCFECPTGYYSLVDSNASKCNVCPENAICEGGDLIKAKNNFWRKDLTTANVYECHKISKPCISDYVGKCKEGYEGVACGGCLHNNQRHFYREDRSFCRECDEIFPYIILWVFLIIFFLYTFNSVIQPGVREREGNDLALRMLFNHFQTIGYFFALYIDFPKYLQDFSKVAYAFMSIDFFLTPIDCIMTSKSITHYGLKTLLAFFFLIATCLIVVVYWSVVGYRKKSDLQEIKDKIKQSLMSLFYLLQPMYVYFCINNLVCRQLTDGNYYLVYNTDEQCWNKAHILYAILLLFPMLFIFMIIIPFFWLRFMRRNKDYLDEHYVLVWTKFISMGVDLKRCYYWEFIVMLRKGLILIFATSLHYNDIGAVNMCIIIISIFNFLQIYISPFKTEKLNNLEALSLNACFFSFISALVYKKNQIEESLKHFFFTLILLFNFVYFIYWFKAFSIRFSSFVNIILGYLHRLKVIYNFFFRNKFRNLEIKVDPENKPNLKSMISPKFTISKNDHQHIEVVKNQFDKKFDDSSEII